MSRKKKKNTEKRFKDKIGSSWKENLKISDIENKELRKITKEMFKGKIDTSKFKEKYRETKNTGNLSVKDIEASMKFFKAKINEKKRKK